MQIRYILALLTLTSTVLSIPIADSPSEQSLSNLVVRDDELEPPAASSDATPDAGPPAGVDSDTSEPTGTKPGSSYILQTQKPSKGEVFFRFWLKKGMNSAQADQTLKPKLEKLKDSKGAKLVLKGTTAAMWSLKTKCYFIVGAVLTKDLPDLKNALKKFHPVVEEGKFKVSKKLGGSGKEE